MFTALHFVLLRSISVRLGFYRIQQNMFSNKRLLSLKSIYIFQLIADTIHLHVHEKRQSTAISSIPLPFEAASDQTAQMTT
jgi:hypothetical protein